jgi:hypothetical protein
MLVRHRLVRVCWAWITTKSIEKLQDKLDIFIAVHNGDVFC